MQELRGNILQYKTRNKTTGDCVFYISYNGQIVTCYGKTPYYPGKTALICNGEWEFTDETGYLFHVSKTSADIKNKAYVRTLISSNPTFKGEFSTKEINSILEILPKIYSSSIQKTIDMVIDLTGKDYNKVYSLVLFLQGVREKDKLFQFLAPYGGDANICEKVFSKFGSDSVDVIRKKPFEALIETGLNLDAIDKIAYDNNLCFYSKERIKCILKEAFNQILSKGHTKASFKEILHAFRHVEKSSSYVDAVPDFLIFSCLSLSKEYIVEDGEYYRAVDYNSECLLAKNIMRIKRSTKYFAVEESIIQDFATKAGVLFDAGQFDAIKGCLSGSGIHIISGGPGSGKTTTCNAILHLWNKIHPDDVIYTGAPSACAARRLRETSHFPSDTAHKLLGLSPNKYVDMENKLEGCDLFLMDEVSMLDMYVAGELFKTMKNGSCIILVGDINQLEAVENGNIVLDMIETGLFDVHYLNQIHRQGEGSSIIENSKKILEGDTILLQDDNFKIERFENSDDLKIALLKLYFEDTNTQILSFTRKGSLGTNSLNALIAPQNGSYMDIGNTRIYQGSRVIFTRNNYKTNYLNGDIGYVDQINKNTISVELPEIDIEVGGKDLNDIELSYAITAHKSQGSEYDSVIIVLSKDVMNMLYRNILYVAVTRAKKKVTVLSMDDALYYAIHNKRVKRNTGLKRKLITMP